MGLELGHTKGAHKWKGFKDSENRLIDLQMVVGWRKEVNRKR